jgi:hypothetical protein
MYPLARPLLGGLLVLWACAQQAAPTDHEQVLQLVIDLPKLQQYYHSDTLKSRRPLRIFLNDAVPKPLRLIKFGQPVEFLKESESAGKPGLVFDQVDVRSESAQIRGRYAVEGVAIGARLKKQDGRWTVLEAQIHER